ncbi:MAG: CBS domain-containing protein [Paucibacter sp.]|nr:CBS domain-containing protein [Roseateles sp.]
MTDTDMLGQTVADTDNKVETSTVAPPAVSAIQAVARSRLLTVPADAHLVEVAALLSSAQISVVVVCGSGGEVLGIITETMLVRQLGLGQANFFSTRADAVMSREIKSCGLQDLLPDVVATMHKLGLIHVLLVDADNKPLGVVNVRDGLRALLLAGNKEEELLRNYVMGVGYQ